MRSLKQAQFDEVEREFQAEPCASKERTWLAIACSLVHADNNSRTMPRPKSL